MHILLSHPPTRQPGGRRCYCRKRSACHQPALTSVLLHWPPVDEAWWRPNRVAACLTQVSPVAPLTLHCTQSDRPILMRSGGLDLFICFVSICPPLPGPSWPPPGSDVCITAINYLGSGEKPNCARTINFSAAFYHLTCLKLDHWIDNKTHKSMIWGMMSVNQRFVQRLQFQGEINHLNLWAHWLAADKVAAQK